MPFLLAEILNFQGSTHHIGVGSFSHLLKEIYFMKLNEIEITDFNALEFDIYARCNEAQLLHYFEPNPGIFIAESPKVIERALNAGYVPISFLAEKRLVSADGGENQTAS